MATQPSLNHPSIFVHAPAGKVPIATATILRTTNTDIISSSPRVQLAFPYEVKEANSYATTTLPPIAESSYTMSPVGPAESDDVVAQPAIDPISRQILERTHTQHKLPQTHHNIPASFSTTTPSEDGKVAARHHVGPEFSQARRADTSMSTASKPNKDKKKGVSFLSRIMGNKKREDSVDFDDAASEIIDNRPLGADAEVFSQPIGFIPKFPAPPRYIRVKPQNRKQRDLDRLFLAQILSESQKSRSRKASLEVDAKIHSIDEVPPIPPPNSSRVANNAVWAAEFSKDGHYLAAAGQDKKLRVWQVIAGKDDREAEDSVEGGESEENVKLNAPVFKQAPLREYDGHKSAILDLSWSKNNFLLSSSMDKTVRLYHVSRSECLCTFKHNDFVTSIQFHPRDDRFFLAGSLDSKLRLWSIPDKSVAYTAHIQDMVTAVAFTPDGKTAIAGTLSGLCTLHDTEGLKPHSQIHVRSARGKNAKGSKITGIDTIAIPRPNGLSDVKLLITSNDSRVRMYNLKDRALEIKFRGNENTCSQIRATFSDDGKYIICGSEDKKVYVWPTGPLERPDSDKRPVEIFEAHSAIVTTAILAPLKARKLLAGSGDPIYDLCNPPPVRLLSRADSALSSRAPTQKSGSEDQHATGPSPMASDSPKIPEESPAYLSRQSHADGHIIVTADYTGQIKVYRQDCAYQKRKDASWDTGSTFSKKVLGRSGSIITKSSTSSHRNSTVLNSKNPTADRIINWRDSIQTSSNSGNGSTTNNSETQLPNATRDREDSLSPHRKPISKRFSLRHHSTPLADAHNPSSPETVRLTNTNTKSPGGVTVSDSPYYSASERRRSSSIPFINIQQQFSRHEDTSTQPQPQPENIAGGPVVSKSPNIGDDDNDPLFLDGDQSLMAWDVNNNLIPMIRAKPRTPGSLGPDGNPISRAQSFLSELSIERPSGSSRSQSLSRKNSAVNPDGREQDGDELKCANCASESFRLVKGSMGAGKLKCRSCGTVI